MSKVLFDIDSIHYNIFLEYLKKYSSPDKIRTTLYVSTFRRIPKVGYISENVLYL